MTRVAVTTSAARVESAAAAYREHGLVPVLLPCIAIEPAGRAAVDLVHSTAGEADWIVVTSATAVEVVWGEDNPMPTTPVAAVGGTTARAVRDAGGVVGLVGAAGVGDLLSRLGEGPGRVVYPHATGADPGALDLLANAGWEVVGAAVYETVPLSPGDDPVDAVAFASPSAVAGWCSTRGLDGLVLCAIGPTTESALSDRGRPPDVVADRPSHTRLAAALASHLRERTTP